MPLLTQLNADEICGAFRDRVNEFIECGREDDATIYLDTPFILSDGHAMRVYFRENANGSITVSDGFFATNFIELWIKSDTTRERLYGEMTQIAHDLHLKWDGQFTFDADDVKGAVKRAAVLYRAVEQSLNVVPAERHVKRIDLTSTLAEALRKKGLHVARNHRFGPPDDSITVDLAVDNKRNGLALIEAISGSDQSSAMSSLGRAAVNMRFLIRKGSAAELFAVVGTDTAAALPNVRSKIPFEFADGRVTLVDAEEAPDRIAATLLAS